MYQREGGVFVADKYTEPQLSTQIYFKDRTLAKAAISTQLGGPTGNDVVSFMDWKDKWAYWNAIRKFPTLQSCLSDGGDGANTLLKLNWNALRTNTQVVICLYHVGVALKNPEAIAEWFKTQGFKASVFRDYYVPKHGRGKFVNIQGNWAASSGSPYPLISAQTLEQYNPPFSLLLGVGSPHISISIGPKKNIFRTSVNNLASK